MASLEQIRPDGGVAMIAGISQRRHVAPFRVGRPTRLRPVPPDRRRVDLDGSYPPKPTRRILTNLKRNLLGSLQIGFGVNLRRLSALVPQDQAGPLDAVVPSQLRRGRMTELIRPPGVQLARAGGLSASLARWSADAVSGITRSSCGMSKAISHARSTARR